jgi:hypothetical protein
VSEVILLAGPPLSVARGAEVILDIAPLVIARPLSLVEVERKTLDDADGRGGCWAARWRDGDVELEASVGNGPGNPRDGYGYSMSVKLFSPYGEKASWWRAEFYGGGWEPHLTSPIRLGLLGVSPDAYAAIRARVLELLPEHRDITLEDAYAVRELVSSFDHHGHVEWVRDFLAQPLVPGVPWVTAELCARKIALRGADAETARTWVTRAPFASSGWSALAEAGGDANTSAESALFLAALTHPFSPVTIELAAPSFPVEGGALAGAMAHLFRDDRFRWLGAADRDAFQLRADAWQPSPSRRVVWQRPAHLAYSAIDAEIVKLLGIPRVHAVTPEHVASGPPLANAGALTSRCGVGTGHSLRRAAIDVDVPAPRSRAIALCHVNCEDRLSSFGFAWLDPTAQVVWRWSLTGEGEAATRSPIEIDVIDLGNGAMGDSWVATLTAAAQCPRRSDAL